MTNNDNKNNTSILHRWGKPLCVLLIALGVFVAHRYQQFDTLRGNYSNDISNSCKFVDGECVFLVQGMLANARFSQPPEPETSVTIMLNLPDDYQIESAWIEGVNMYMGKVPVLLEQNNSNEWQGWFMLGSCSEENMNWQLRLNIKGQAAPSYLYFSTSR